MALQLTATRSVYFRCSMRTEQEVKMFTPTRPSNFITSEILTARSARGKWAVEAAYGQSWGPWGKWEGEGEGDKGIEREDLEAFPLALSTTDLVPMTVFTGSRALVVKVPPS